VSNAKRRKQKFAAAVFQNHPSIERIAMKHILIGLLAAVGLAGCSYRAEVDFIRKAMSNEDQQDRTKLHVGVAARIGQEPQPLEQQPRTAERSAPSEKEGRNPAAGTKIGPVGQPSTTIIIGSINVHVGDVNHVHVIQNTFNVKQATITAPLRPSCKTQPQLDEKCERLRREHEAQVAEWKALFAEGRQQ
jgi:hypothetical protein